MIQAAGIENPRDYETTFTDPSTTGGATTTDYDLRARGKLCPLKRENGVDYWRACDGARCAWYDERREWCAVLSLARRK